VSESHSWHGHGHLRHAVEWQSIWSVAQTSISAWASAGIAVPSVMAAHRELIFINALWEVLRTCETA